MYIGAGDHTLFFIQEDGTVWFSGENGHYEARAGALGYAQLAPAIVAPSIDQGGVKGRIAILQGKAEDQGEFTMGIYAAGDNTYGQLGIGVIYTYTCPDCGEKFRTGDPEISGIGAKVMLTHQVAQKDDKGNVLRDEVTGEILTRVASKGGLPSFKVSYKVSPTMEAEKSSTPSIPLSLVRRIFLIPML